MSSAAKLEVAALAVKVRVKVASGGRSICNGVRTICGGDGYGRSARFEFVNAHLTRIASTIIIISSSDRTRSPAAFMETDAPNCSFASTPSISL